VGSIKTGTYFSRTKPLWALFGLEICLSPAKSPVAYVEGIYVKAKYRNQDVGRTLIQYAEQWAREQGCIELALDALLDNPASHEFYTKVGFREVERVVFFIKSAGANHFGLS
jgi:GNAT superfamily N-acetyltransferase